MSRSARWSEADVAGLEQRLGVALPTPRRPLARPGNGAAPAAWTSGKGNHSGRRARCLS